MKRQYTKWHSLMWYDGSHLSIRGERYDEIDDNPIVEVRTWAADIAGQPDAEPTQVKVRLTLDDVRQMLDLLEGRAVNDEVSHEEPSIPTWDAPKEEHP